MRYGVFGVVLSLALVRSSLGHAQESPPREEPQTTAPAEIRHWYGWQTFTADGAALGLFAAGVAEHHNTALYGGSAVVFALGAPVVHLAHRHWEYALCSVGLRAAGPLLGVLIGSQGDPDNTHAASSSGSSSTKWATTGVAIGGAVVSLFDGFILAYDVDPAPAAKPERNQLLKVLLTPALTLVPHGALVGLTGTL